KWTLGASSPNLRARGRDARCPSRSASPMTLTKRQRKILEFIKDFSERRGYAPTLAEIGRHFGLRSPATVHKHLRNLEERGALKRHWNHSRAIEVLPEEGTTPSFHLPLVGILEAMKPLEMRIAEQSVPVPAG